jgi:streptogramin lyase
MPGSDNLVPPGYYMLFLVNAKGVPSIAHWVRVLPAAQGGLELNPGDIIVGTAGRLLRVDPQTMATDVITQGGSLGNAEGIAFDTHGHLVIVTDGGDVVHVVPETGVQRVVHASGRLWQDVAVRPDGDSVVVNLPSATPSGLFRIDHETGADTKLNTGTNFGDGPTGVVIGPDGHYYVAELGARAVIRVDQTSGAETVISQAGHFNSPSGIAVATNSHLPVVDHGADKVIDVDPVSGAQQAVSSGDELEAPVGIAVEQDGQILVVDLVGDKLIRIDPNNGSQTVLAQGGPLAGIRSVAVVGG